MKIFNLLNALTILLSLSFLTSCVSYETTTSEKKKKTTSSHVYASNNTNKSTTTKKASVAEKKEAKKKTASKTNKTPTSSDIKLVIKEAEKYKGTPYKFGGTTSSGIDCSGLVGNAYKKIDIELPRRSIDMSNEGKEIKISNVKEGDLIFFATGGGSINHVGIVHNVSSSGEVFFIHASTSKGVMISSLEENYWKGRVKKARRII